MEITIHHYVHSVEPDTKLDKIIDSLTRLETNILALKADFETLRLAMNDATNKIAARIEDLMSKSRRAGSADYLG